MLSYVLARDRGMGWSAIGRLMGTTHSTALSASARVSRALGEPRVRPANAGRAGRLSWRC